MPSTAKHDALSRIVPTLTPGSGVVASRGSIHYVVTEWGIAYLHGRSIRERAEALINIAHPKFRNDLYDYCEKTRWLQRPLLHLEEMAGQINTKDAPPISANAKNQAR